MTSRFSISRAWDETKARLASDGRLLVAVALALVLLPQAVAVAIAPPQELGAGPQPLSSSLLMLAAALFGMVGQLALVRLALKSDISVGEAIGHGARRLPTLLGALFLLGIALAIVLIPILIVLIMLGAIPTEGTPDYARITATLALVMVVVVLAVSPKFQLVMPLASAEPVGPVKALKRSWHLSKGHYWPLLGFILLLLLAAVVMVAPAQLVGGVIAKVLSPDVEPLSIGALVYALMVAVAQTALVILSSLMLARVYAQLAGDEVLEPSVPRTGG